MFSSVGSDFLVNTVFSYRPSREAGLQVIKLHSVHIGVDFHDFTFLESRFATFFHLYSITCRI
jgi:hypothetical protein